MLLGPFGVGVINDQLVVSRAAPAPLGKRPIESNAPVAAVLSRPNSSTSLPATSNAAARPTPSTSAPVLYTTASIRVAVAGIAVTNWPFGKSDALPRKRA